MREISTLFNFEVKQMFRSKGVITSFIIFILLLPIALAVIEPGESARETWYGTLQMQMIFLLILIPSYVSYLWKGDLQPFEKNIILIKVKKPLYYILAKQFAVISILCSSLFIFYSGLYFFHFTSLSLQLLLITFIQLFITILFSVTLVFLLSFFAKRTIYLNIVMIVYFFLSIGYFNSPYYSIWFNPDFILIHMENFDFILKRFTMLLFGIICMAINLHLFHKRVRV